MDFRKVTLADKPAIARLHRASISQLCAGHYTGTQLEAWLGMLQPSVYDQAIAEKLFILAEEGNEPLGFGMLDVQAGEVSALYLAPEKTGLGIGSNLLQALEQAAVNNGLTRLTLQSTLNARGFYAHHGYRPIEEAHHTLPDGTLLPCIKMAKQLSAPE